MDKKKQIELEKIKKAVNKNAQNRITAIKTVSNAVKTIDSKDSEGIKNIATLVDELELCNENQSETMKKEDITTLIDKIRANGSLGDLANNINRQNRNQNQRGE